MTTDQQDPFAVPGGGVQQQQQDPFAVPGGAQQDPFAAPQVQGGHLEPHRGSTVLVFGILGMVCLFPFGIVAWVMGSKDLKKMAAGEMDASGRGVTMAGKIIGTVATFVNPLVWLLNIASMAQ
jgi:hypothetical protein